MAATDGYGSGSIITPEAVVLDFELAGLGSRAIAYFVDLVVQVAALFVMSLIVGAIAFGSELAAIIFLLVSLILIVVGYPTIMETLNGGRTLGRMVVNTRVVTVEGAPIRFRHAFIRALLGIIDLIATAGGVAVVSALVTRRGQRLGDLAAGTMVLREAAHSGSTSPVSFYPPAYLAAWAQTLDTATLGDDAYLLIRDVVTDPELSFEARRNLADEVAALVSERLPHAAKTSAVPSMDYLTAVATAAQTRARSLAPAPPAPAPPAPAPPAPAPPFAASPFLAPPVPPRGSPHRPTSPPGGYPQTPTAPVPPPTWQPSTPTDVPQTPSTPPVVPTPVSPTPPVVPTPVSPIPVAPTPVSPPPVSAAPVQPVFPVEPPQSPPIQNPVQPGPAEPSQEVPAPTFEGLVNEDDQTQSPQTQSPQTQSPQAPQPPDGGFATPG